MTSERRVLGAWLIAVIALAMLLGAGCSTGDDSAVAEEEAVVVPPSKADNFFSLSAQEYMVEGVAYVELEPEFKDRSEEEQLVRVKELVYYRQIAVNWFLLKFLMGTDKHDNKYESLTKNGSYEDLELKRQEDDPLRFTFKFRQEIAGQMDLLDELPAELGEDGRHHFELPVGKVSNEELAKLDLNKEWYRKSPWSAFDPATIDAAKLEHIDLAIWPEERSSDAWIDYLRLFEDGELTVSVHFGWDYHKEYHLVHSQDVYNWLVSRGFESPVASYEEYTRTSGPLTGAITSQGKEIKVSIWLYWGKPGTDTDPDTDAGGKVLEDDMKEAFKTRDAVVFSGHSGPFYGFALANWRKTDQGDIDDSEVASLEMPTDKYQVVMAEGCDTYAMGQSFWENPNKPGRTNLDVLTTTNFSNASTAGVVRNFLLSLMDERSTEHQPWKYSELLRKLDGNSYWFSSMYGVHGIDDNPRLHPYAVVENLCTECQDDADCGPVGNKCVRMSPEEKVCAAECISTDACPSGYECVNVAQGSWLTSMQCIPIGYTCAVTPVEPERPKVMINELLADPAADLAGDANGDGVRDAVEDEFVELVSLSGQPVDLAGWLISDGFGTRFVFPAGTELLPGRALLVFGGGNAATVRDFASDTGAVLLLGDGLGFNNDGDTITLYRQDGTASDSFTYGSEGGKNVSLTRTVDGDMDAAFVPHPGDLPFSPGTRHDGSHF